MTTDTDLLTRLQAAWQEPPDGKPPPNKELFHDETIPDSSDSDYGWAFDCSPSPKTKKPLPWCPRFQHPRAWRSIYGAHLICATCHPPAVESVIAEWIDG
jgi:hypothetical protein